MLRYFLLLGKLHKNKSSYYIAERAQYFLRPYSTSHELLGIVLVH